MGSGFDVGINALQIALAAVADRRWEAEQLPVQLEEEISAGLAKQAERIRAITELIPQWLAAYERQKESYPDSVADPYHVSEWIPVGSASVWRVDSDEKGFEPFTSHHAKAPETSEIEVVVYLDGYSDADLQQVLKAATALAEELGYEDFSLTEQSTGSIFKRLTGKVQQGVTSQQARALAQQVEHGISLATIGKLQAEVDAVNASSIADLIKALENVDVGCVRVGGILVLKFPTGNGAPAVLAHPLSVKEIRALEKNPGIQKDPAGALELLATAVYQLELEQGEESA